MDLDLDRLKKSNKIGSFKIRKQELFNKLGFNEVGLKSCFTISLACLQQLVSICQRGTLKVTMVTYQTICYHS